MNGLKKSLVLLLAFTMLVGCGAKQPTSQQTSSVSQPQSSAVSSQSAESQPTAEPTAPALPQFTNDMPLAQQGKSALSGRDTDVANQRPVAVMLYNQKAAFPQWGVSDMQILMEANTEGQDTWLMALYDGTDQVTKVGPVGQGRDLFLQMVMPLQAIPMFIGNDVYTSNLLNYYGYQPLNGVFAGTSAFDLDAERAKTYTDQYSWYAHKELISGALQQYNQTIEGETHNFFQFAEGKTPQNTQGYELDVTYGSQRTARLVYETDDQRYYLMDGDTNQVDANHPEDDAIRFTNVILLMARSGYKDNGVTREYDLSSGDGVYLSAGGYTAIRWEKGDAQQPLKLYDTNGQMLNVQPGRTYLGIYGGFEGQSLRLLDSSGAEQSLPQTPQPLPTPVPTETPQPTEQPDEQATSQS